MLSKLIDDGLSGADPAIVCHSTQPRRTATSATRSSGRRPIPALGKFRDYEDLATAIRKAMRMPAEEPKVRNLFLNQRVAPIAVADSPAGMDGVRGRVAFDDGEEVYLALDLSSVVDLTALLVGSAADPARVMPYFWKPREHLTEHSHRDFGSGSHRYLEWAEAGYLRISPGRTIDPRRLRCSSPK